MRVSGPITGVVVFDKVEYSRQTQHALGKVTCPGAVVNGGGRSACLKHVDGREIARPYRGYPQWGCQFLFVSRYQGTSQEYPDVFVVFS